MTNATLRQFNLNQLRVFEVVFRTGSMTSASRDLHLTQPGISQHIQGLEETLGLRLFDRINRKLIPTSHGRRLYASCQTALVEIEKALAEIQGPAGQLQGLLRIGMPV